MSNLKIIWTAKAKQDLKNIFEYWKTISVQGARNVVTDIFNSPKTIYFANQYQIDDINSKYRRMIVGSYYKVRYKASDDKFYIIGVVSTFQSPKTIENLWNKEPLFTSQYKNPMTSSKKSQGV